MHRQFLISLLGLVCLASFAQAECVSFSSIVSDPLYTVTQDDSDTLGLDPVTYQALGEDGIDDMLCSTVSVDITADAGKQITGICFDEFGDYTTVAGGEVVSALNWTISSINGVATSLSGSSIWTGTTGGPFTNGIELDSTDWGGGIITSMSFSLENCLEGNVSQASMAASAFIKKKITTGLMVKSAVVPEPSSIGLLLFGGLGLLRRRRRA